MSRTHLFLLTLVLNLLTSFRRDIHYIVITPYTIELNIKHGCLINSIKYLKLFSRFLYNTISDIVAIDNLVYPYRFKLVYELLNIGLPTRLQLGLFCSELIPVQSIVSIFNSAAWSEREIWDLFGILFLNHPDLRRILTDYGFSGHALRKDFPISGFVELIYNDSLKRVCFKDVSLAQELRLYKRANPWLQ